MAAPPGVQNVGSTGFGLMVNATLPLCLYQGARGIPPPLRVLPQPFGFNLVLLANNSAAVLDPRRQEYLLAIQHELTPDETIMIEAEVCGTVTTVDESFSSSRDTTSFWEP